MGAPLTSAQMEMLRLIARGRTNAQVAHELGVSINTVKTRISVIGTRLGLHGRDEITARVFEAGLEVVGAPTAESAPGVPSVDAELAEQLLEMARMIVTDQPLGQLRKVAHQALLADARRRRDEAA